MPASAQGGPHHTEVKCGRIASDKKRKNITIFCRAMNVTLHFYVVFYTTISKKVFNSVGKGWLIVIMY